MAKKKKKFTRKVVSERNYCLFCSEKKDPDYKDHKMLYRLITDRAKIIGKARSGLCSTHQRHLGTEIKRARHLGLLPYTPEI